MTQPHFDPKVSGLATDPILAPLRRWQADSLILGGVVLTNKLGEGGMGAVYRGLHTRFNIPMAVKVLKDASTQNRSLFVREARMTVRIEHPNLVRVYDVNVDAVSGLNYIVMEYVEGGSVHELLWQSVHKQGRALSQIAAAEICLSAAKAVAAAHAQGIIHRDLKPENLLVRSSDGCVKVTDLGLAGPVQVFHDEAKRRRSSALGTVGFTSPEIICGEPATFAADIYALGATLYELITGVLPFGVFEHDLEYTTRQLNTPVADPRARVPEMDEELAVLILACLETEPARRPQDMETVAATLQQILLRLTGRAPELPRANTDFVVRGDEPTVLCIDDDKAILNLLDTVLRSNGYKPVCYDDPNMALQYLRLVKPDLIICDMQMPQMTGLEAVRRIKEMPGMAEVPVLVFSGHNDPDSVYAALQLGVTDYLLKPFGLQDLLQRLQLLTRIRVMDQERAKLEQQLRGLAVPVTHMPPVRHMTPVPALAG